MVMRGSRAGDIRVIGLVAGTHVIEDIGRDVPHGVQVVIPGHLAVQSKDLYRAISQKCLLQLPTAAPPPQYIGPGVGQETEHLELQIRELSERLKVLEAENKVLREKKDESQTAQKLDEIIQALQNQTTIMVPVGKDASVPEEEKVDGSAPMFLPDKIRPEDADVRIDVSGKAAPSDAMNAANKLRQLRKEKES